MSLGCVSTRGGIGEHRACDEPLANALDARGSELAGTSHKAGQVSHLGSEEFQGPGQ